MSPDGGVNGVQLAASGSGNSEPAAQKASPRRRAPAQPAQAPAPALTAVEPEGCPAASAPLSAVVSNAVRRWFIDAHKEAIRGDVKQQALLGQMLQQGYGCKADAAVGKEWADKARRRGYRMSGVYCEL
ncbi:hypothetical protein WJX81_004307 [Elliptochloris bilobata]|uniref:Floricaula/leafy-like transcription factor n=1 Tax=Elliptochloris bilobata TaxID=381761 RepID=A0AAW1QL38_9CHLO